MAYEFTVVSLSLLKNITTTNTVTTNNNMILACTSQIYWIPVLP